MNVRIVFMKTNNFFVRKSISSPRTTKRDDAADRLTHDPIFTQVLGTTALATQPSLSRFFECFDAQSLHQLQAENQELFDRVNPAR